MERIRSTRRRNVQVLVRLWPLSVWRADPREEPPGDGSREGSEQYLLYKNNSDGKGNSYGYHENYLVSRAVPFDKIARVLTPFLVTRPIFAGAGKVGAENQTSPAEYQISQRADFFECLMDLNTMVKRPIINTRRTACRCGTISKTACHHR